MRRLPALLCTALCALLLAACGGDDDTESAATPTPTATATPAATEGAAPGECREVPKPKAKRDGGEKKPTLTLDAAKTYVATVETNCGAFEITLDAKRAPKTGGAFVTLARKGFFDDLTFHRIVPGFVIQGGDPAGSGQGGPGFSVVEEPPADLTYEEGVVAMAKTGMDPPGTSGSQFFVVTGEGGAQLPPEYALLGKVTKGLEVAQAIGAVETTPDEQPASPVVIESIEVAES